MIYRSVLVCLHAMLHTFSGLACTKASPEKENREDLPTSIYYKGCVLAIIQSDKSPVLQDRGKAGSLGSSVCTVGLKT